MQLAGVTETVTVTGADARRRHDVDDDRRQRRRRSSSTSCRCAATSTPSTRDGAGRTTEDASARSCTDRSSAENQYIIDGLNTTGVEVGDKGKTLNFDFVQEVEVKTGGLPAEYGRMTGGVVNVVTKSGGNMFSGSVFGSTPKAARSRPTTTPRDKRPAWTTTQSPTSHSRGDFGGELGGLHRQGPPVVLRRVQPRRTRIDNTTVIRTIDVAGQSRHRQRGSDVHRSRSVCGEADLHASRRPDAQRHRQRRSDPRATATSSRSPARRARGRAIVNTGGTDYVGKYDGVFGSRFLVQRHGARHNESDKYQRRRARHPAVDRSDGDAERRLRRLRILPGSGLQRATSSRPTRPATWARHDIKVGVDCEHIKAVNNNYNGGAGQRIYKLSTSGGTGTIYYRHRYYVNDRGAGFDRNDPIDVADRRCRSRPSRTRTTRRSTRRTWKAGAGLHDQRRHPLGSAERPQPRQGDARSS